MSEGVKLETFSSVNFLCKETNVVDEIQVLVEL